MNYELLTITYMRRGMHCPTCAEVKAKAMEAQASCYTTVDSGQSICDLPCADYASVFWLTKSSYSAQINDTAAKFAALEAITCQKNGDSLCALFSRPKPVTCRAAFRSTSYLNQYRLVGNLIEPFDRTTACPFAKTSTVTDNELAYAIVDSISLTFRWEEDTTVDWYAMSKRYDARESTIYIEVTSSETTTLQFMVSF